jgi:hypothetical protein
MRVRGQALLDDYWIAAEFLTIRLGCLKDN